jgi:hypothetical protein
MKYTITIECDNAAFDPPAQEVARILRQLADQCERYDSPPQVTLFDINGNRVGKAKPTGKQP